MNRETHAMIRSRAERMAPFLADHLTNTDPADYERGHAYRMAYLLLRGPREFLRAFQHGELHLDATAIETVFWELRGEIPGPDGLMPEERALIRDHNAAVDDLLRRKPRTAPVVSISERRAIGLHR